MKRCGKCRVTKPLAMFYKNITKKDGFKNECKPCSESGRSERYAVNRDRLILAKRAWTRLNNEKLNKIRRDRYAADPTRARSIILKSRFGITMEQYDVMVDSQGGCCAICNREENKKPMQRLSVDHCHVTGKLRGLLCSRCNTALGQFRDDSTILQSAIRYLGRYQ